jgi:fucose permease
VRIDRSGPLLVAAGGLLAFVMLGWSGLLIPSLIRDVERDLRVSDADMGTAYLLNAATFTAGCLLAGWATPIVGRRTVLLAAIAAISTGCVVLLAGSWPLFLVGMGLRGLGSGVIEVGIQGLFMVAFLSRQRRAVNTVHFSYSLGAAIAPLAIAGLLGAGIAWTGLGGATAVPWLVAGLILALAPMDSGRRDAAAPPARLRPSLALVAGCAAIAVYVGAEVGVSSWVVRFLASAPLELAAAALTLFWAALAVSRLLAVRVGDSVRPERLALAGFLGAAVAIVAAVVVPSVPASIALFGVAGFAFGPVYAAIILLGARIPGRRDAVTGILASSGVGGSLFYPPLMGVISVGVGLGPAMAGTAILASAGAVFVLIAVRALSAAPGATDRTHAEATSR